MLYLFVLGMETLLELQRRKKAVHWGFRAVQELVSAAFIYVRGSEALCFPAYISGREILLFVLSQSLLCLSVRRCTLLSLTVLA